MKINKLLINLFGVSLAAWTVGCETIIDVDLPEHEPALVINSIFGNAKRFMLAEKVSFGDKYFRIEDDFSVNAKSWFMMPFSFVLEEMRV